MGTLRSPQTGLPHSCFRPLDRLDGPPDFHDLRSRERFAEGVHIPFGTQNGDFVAFVSYAVNVVTEQFDDNLSTDVFLYSRVSGTNVLVSHVAGDPSTAGDGFADAPAISADGLQLVDPLGHGIPLPWLTDWTSRHLTRIRCGAWFGVPLPE